MILTAYQPSLTELARDTGRDRRSIMRYLAVLERRGWVVRARPPAELARRLHQRTQYAMQIPDSPQARDTSPSGLGTGRPRASGTMPPGLGTASPQARGTAPHRSSVSSGSSAAEVDAVIKAIWEKTGQTVTAEWAERVRAQVLGARDNVRHPEAYLRRVIGDAPPDTYLPHDLPPRGCQRCGQPGHQKPDCPN